MIWGKPYFRKPPSAKKTTWIWSCPGRFDVECATLRWSSRGVMMSNLWGLTQICLKTGRPQEIVVCTIRKMMILNHEISGNFFPQAQIEHLNQPRWKDILKSLTLEASPWCLDKWHWGCRSCCYWIQWGVANQDGDYNGLYIYIYIAANQHEDSNQPTKGTPETAWHNGC